MHDLETLMIERACARLVTRYCHLVDSGAASRVADLFTEDGIWSSPEKTMVGRDEIARGFAARERNAARMSRHVCNNLLLDIEDGNTARGVVYLTLYRHDGEPGPRTSPLIGPVLVGEYRDRFVQTDAGWRFQRRETVISFAATGN